MVGFERAMALRVRSVHSRVFFPTLMMFNTAFWAVTLAVVFRDPTQGQIWLMGPLFCTMAAMAERNRVARAHALMLNLLFFGFWQMVFAAFYPNLLVVVLTLPLAVYLTGFRRRASNASVVVVASLMNFGHANWQVGVDIFALLVILALIVPVCGLALDRIFFGDSGCWRGIPSPVPGLEHEALFRRSIALMLTMSIADMLDWNYGYWIPFTVTFCYVKGFTGRKSCRIAWLRILWAPVGLAIAVMYLETFGFVDYQFAYLAVLFGTVAYAYSFGTREFIGASLLTILMLSSIKDIVAGNYADFSNGWDMVMQSSLAVVIGALCVIAVEYWPDRVMGAKKRVRINRTEEGRGVI